MNKVMERKVLEQLSLVERKLYCIHNREQACEECLKKISGYEGLSGDCSGLSGNCSGLVGDCSGLVGNCSNLIGDCSELRGDCSGLSGYCSGLSGDCEEIKKVLAKQILRQVKRDEV